MYISFFQFRDGQLGFFFRGKHLKRVFFISICYGRWRQRKLQFSRVDLNSLPGGPRVYPALNGYGGGGNGSNGSSGDLSGLGLNLNGNGTGGFGVGPPTPSRRAPAPPPRPSNDYENFGGGPNSPTGNDPAHYGQSPFFSSFFHLCFI
jgi:hypothetical protein